MRNHPTIQYPLAFASEITQPTFDDSARLFQMLASVNPASTFRNVANEDHGFLKGCGRDPIAVSELQTVCQWVDMPKKKP
jgi:acetyl esterase